MGRDLMSSDVILYSPQLCLRRQRLCQRSASPPTSSLPCPPTEVSVAPSTPTLPRQSRPPWRNVLTTAPLLSSVLGTRLASSSSAHRRRRSCSPSTTLGNVPHSLKRLLSLPRRSLTRDSSTTVQRLSTTNSSALEMEGNAANVAYPDL